GGTWLLCDAFRRQGGSSRRGTELRPSAPGTSASPRPLLLPMLISLTLALALAQGPTQADLHPAEADVYVELADVSTLLPALDKAPLIRFRRDERMKGLPALTGQSADKPLIDMVEQGLAQANPKAQPDKWLRGLKSVSFSLVALDAPPAEGQPPVALE